MYYYTLNFNQVTNFNTYMLNQMLDIRKDLKIKIEI